ncbi:hypothetical protein LPJ56_005956, partial [Coemansia sp. RSA 2599]
MATSTASSSAQLATAASQPTIVCPRCCNTPPNLIHDFSSDDLICGDCNTSIDERLASVRAEWRRHRHHQQQQQQQEHMADNHALLASTKYMAHHTDGSSSDGSDKPEACLNRAMR